MRLFRVSRFEFLVAVFSFASAPALLAETTDDDIHDVHGVIHIPPAWLWLVYVAAGIGFVALLYFLWRWWKKRRKEIVKPKLPHEIAFERLLAARALMTAAEAKAYSIAVSDAIRSYIEDRFGERAAHRTTEEFLHDLLAGKTASLSVHIALLDDFLRHCDLVKFARHALTREDMEAMHASALRFVDETKPMPDDLKK